MPNNPSEAEHESNGKQEDLKTWPLTLICKLCSMVDKLSQFLKPVYA